jgi:hypothetical protein
MHAFLLNAKCVCYTLKHAKRYLSSMPDGASQYFAMDFHRLLNQVLDNAHTVGFELGWHNQALHVDMRQDCAHITVLLADNKTSTTSTTTSRQYVARQTRIVKQACLYTSLVGCNMFASTISTNPTILVQPDAEPVYLAFCGVSIEKCSWHDASSMFGRQQRPDSSGTSLTSLTLTTRFPINWHAKLDEIVRYKPYCSMFTDQLVRHIRSIKADRYSRHC